MVEINISVDNDVLQQFQAALARSGSGGFPGVSAALEDSAEGVRKMWQGFARGGNLEGIESLKRPRGGYARSIKTRNYGPFNYEVYSDAKVAEWIENGTEELDMKTKHPFGPRSRKAQTGKNKGYPYLIVPFRWGTPRTVGFRNIMPREVYNIVKNKVKFRQTKTTVSADKSSVMTPNASGEMVGRAQYSDVTESKSWGDRLTADMGEGVTDNMVGMSRMVGKNGKAAGYLTFRIISAAPGASGWIKPAMKPRPVTQTVANLSRNGINDAVEAAIMGDLANL